jgi:shikimate kinase
MKTYLIGFMGSGKTTAGKRLATRLGFSFVDTDKLFETEHHCSISEYFDLYEEEKFREEERKILHSTQFLQNTVIAVGGGTPCFYDNMDWMLSNGTCVYLEMPPKALYNRLKNSKLERPLLVGAKNLSPSSQAGTKNFSPLQQTIQTLLSQREPFYQKANITVSGINLDIENLCEKIKIHNSIVNRKS